MTPKRLDEMRFAPPLNFEKLDRLYLTAAKATLVTAAIATFLPLVFRAGLQRLIRLRS